MRIDAPDGLNGALGLQSSDVARSVDDLSMQVRERHDVVVDDPQRPDADAREIKQSRRTKPPAPTTRTRAAFSLFCPGPPTPRSTI